MLQRPPTAIVLGQADLSEFEQRQSIRRAVQANREHYEQARFQHSINSHSANLQELDPYHPPLGRRSRNFEGLDIFPNTGALLQQTASKAHEQNDVQDPAFFNSSATRGQKSDMAWTKDDYICTQGSPESTSEDGSHRTQMSPQPFMDDFYYGGFLQNVSQQPAPDQQMQSPSVLNSVKTPQNQHGVDSYSSLRTQPLPRSAMPVSQMTRSSSEHQPTSGLIPRVNSRVATHGSPGVIFQHPPRRLGPLYQTFRHQTNSFLFDSSERSNAAYGQDRVPSTSSAASVFNPTERVNYSEDLPGVVSLTSSRTSSAVGRGSYPEASNIFDTMSHLESFGAADALLPPQQSSMQHNNILVDDPISSAADGEHELRNLLRQSASDSASLSPEAVRRSPSASYTPMGALRSAARLISSYRRRSPSRRRGSSEHPSPSPTSSSTPGQSQSSQSFRLPYRTPSRTYRVYNDQMPATGQPQTPADLPEARHRSRFHPSNTAPVLKAAVRTRGTLLGNDGAASADLFSPRLPASFATPSRQQRDRDRSPAGLLNAGFRGLYGGMENGVEEQNWLDGVRFSNAETRL